MTAAGQKCPDFELANQDGVKRKLSDYAGKWLVLYVYPKDDTPGCTIEAKEFTEARARFESIGASVVGLSADDSASHRAFCDKQGLGIELLADPEHRLLAALGGGQNERGGWKRTTFVIDPKGVVRNVYREVKPAGHPDAVLEDMRALQSGRGASHDSAQR